jgi:hypothetical protein
MIASFIAAFAFVVNKCRHWKKEEDGCSGCSHSKSALNQKK